MDFVLTLHSHLPWVLHHGRWPHGSDWICEAAVDTYLPLVEALLTLEQEHVPAPVTLGVTPVLANQLAHPSFRSELQDFLAQRLEACDEAADALRAAGEDDLIPTTVFWRERLRRMRRLFDRLDGDLAKAFRDLAGRGRLELIGSAATHGFLPLLGYDESIRLQLGLGRQEHHRIFGHFPRGCWVPECAYRPRGRWAPHPDAPAGMRRGIEEHLRDTGFQYFFTDAHQAQAGRSLGLYGEHFTAEGRRATDRGIETADSPAYRSPYHAYRVSPLAGKPDVIALVRDPRSTLQVWSRYQGYPGDGVYLEFHKIRWPGGLKLWRVTGSDLDLGLKEPYDANVGRARAWTHAGHFSSVLGALSHTVAPLGGELVAAPFDTELFGHWWFEGPSFLTDFFRAVARWRPITAATASQHLANDPPQAAIELAEGSWGARGDWSMWLNPGTEWTWQWLWKLERRYWDVARDAIDQPHGHPALAQATRELLLAQSSDWQFIISTGAAADYAEKRFREHCENLDALLSGFEEEGGLGSALERAAALSRRNDPFPEPLAAVRAALGGSRAVSAA